MIKNNIYFCITRYIYQMDCISTRYLLGVCLGTNRSICIGATKAQTFCEATRD